MRGLLATIVARPVTVTMLTVAATLFGLVAASRLPVALLPDLSRAQVSVETEYSGASPDQVEQLVTRRVEELVGAVPGLKSISSRSREGRSEVQLAFAWGTGMDAAVADVREKLDRVRLPIGAERPVVLRYDPAQEPIMRLALVAPEGVTAGELAGLRDLADKSVKRELEKIPGVSAATLHGGYEDEVRVDMDVERLAALEIDPAQLAEAIRSGNVNRPGGSLSEFSYHYQVRTVYEARTAAELGELVVRNQGGASVRLRDVATVHRVPRDREEAMIVDGREAVEIAVHRDGDANAVKVSTAVSAVVGELRLPDHIEVRVLDDRARFIRAAVDEVKHAGVVGGALAVVILMLFLRRVRTTFVLALAIPISVLVAFVPLAALGVSLNLMSLGGLALGVGMLVDNSVVVLEAIARRRDEGSAAVEAAVDGAAEVGPSVVVSTATTVAVFLPMGFVEGVAGQLVYDLSLAVSLSILSSMVVALTLVPMLEARRSARLRGEAPAGPASWLSWAVVPLAVLLRVLRWPATKASDGASRLFAPLDHLGRAAMVVYQAVLAVALRLRFAVVLGVVALAVAAGFGAQTLGRVLVPDAQRDRVSLQLRMPEGTALERTMQVVRTGLAVARLQPGVESTFARVGSLTHAQSAAGVVLGPSLAQLDLTVDDAVADAEAIASAVRGALADAGAELSTGGGDLLSLDAPLAVRVFAEDQSARWAATDVVVPAVAQVEGVAAIATEGRATRPEIRVDFDRERLARLGIGLDVAAAAVSRAVAGEHVGVMHAEDRPVDMIVGVGPKTRDSVEDLKRLPIAVVEGRTVLLGSVASLGRDEGPAVIPRMNGRRGVELRLDVGGRDLARVSADVERAAKSAAGSMAAVKIAGQAGELDASIRNLVFAGLLSAFLVYVVMASGFESLLHPLLIMVTVPLAMIGVVLGALVLGAQLSAMVGLGAIVLCGIVVNNAIVLIAAVNQARGRGMDVEDALKTAAALRLRPIAMTTLTTVLALVPQVVAQGDGAELRQPLAWAVVSGLSFATLLTLIVVPCLYRILPGRRSGAW